MTAYYVRYLREEFSKRCERNQRYSLRAFASSLKISQGSLSEMLSETRIPSPKLLKRIWESIGSEPEVLNELLRSAGTLQRRRGLKRLNPEYRKSGRTRPMKVTDLSVDLYRVIGDWYHSAIIELSFVEGFKSDAKWIARALGISEIEAKHAIQRLEEIGLLECVGGVLVKTSGPTTTADKSISTPALRKYQSQLLEKANASLQHDPIEERDMTGMTMAIDPTLLPEAKLRIQQFTKELTEFLESGLRTRLYQMQLSLYPLQIIEKGKKYEIK